MGVISNDHAWTTNNREQNSFGRSTLARGNHVLKWKKFLDCIFKYLVTRGADVSLITVLNRRRSISELSSRINLSPLATADRIRKREESGILQGFRTVVDPVKAGRGSASVRPHAVLRAKLRVALTGYRLVARSSHHTLCDRSGLLGAHGRGGGHVSD